MVDEKRDITDPKALRALAHPLRWQLLDFLSREGSATATQCAQESGESVASCSYHLNMLAKYDYVVQAEGGKGREKPWRLARQTTRFTDVGLDTEGAVAANAASGAFLEYTLNQIRERHLAVTGAPAEWRNALGVDNTNDFLTVEEVIAFREEVRALMDRYRGRREDPAARPDGARSVNLFFSTTVAPDKS
ncbi:ArsR/SmtB family transcription factor [Actinophytocola glycyrrhizae]|uniref:ArsR/SmtB family transcription factor n=1 Tax=Actinophytocola glycyrrhizae TaxID=2044873 RepID=A0ABV9S948_9PSEU